MISPLQPQALLAAVRELRPLPATSARLASLVARPDTHLVEIVETISYDQTLTLRLLRAANSAASGARVEVRLVKDAIVRLGTGTCLSLAVSDSAGEALGGKSSDAANATLWRHSVAATAAAEVLRGASSLELGPELFTTALLHDVGKLILSRFLDENLREALRRAQQEGGLESSAAELELLGLNHGDVGALVAQHWQLPETIMQGIVYHHEPETIDSPVALAVAVADRLAHAALRDGPEGRDPLAHLSASVLARLELSSTTAEELVQRTAERFEAVFAAYAG